MNITKLTFKTPTSAGVRHQKNILKNSLSKTNRLIKNLCAGLKKDVGRGHNGRITVRHKGGGTKPIYHSLVLNTSFYHAITITVMYDAFRNSFINLNFELTKFFFFKVLGTAFVGSGTLTSYTQHLKELRLGNRFMLGLLPAGALIHSVSINDALIKFVRAAGTAAIVMQRVDGGCKIKLPSGKIVILPLQTSAVLGVVSNAEHSRVVLGKAGRNRLLGVRPSVRGIAMNSVDHPHGGRTNGGRPSCTPWGIPTKGYPTVSKKKKV